MSHPTRVPGFNGRLIWPDDPEFEPARLVENAAFDHRPALVAQALDADDVAAVIGYGRSEGLPLAVRSGGHSVAGHSTGDGVVVLDLAALNQLEIDESTSTAWAGPGVLAGQHTKAAYALGLATSFGDTGTVGLGGLILGGGIGWLVRKHGLTIDSLLAVEVVTAAGDRLVASADEHADLFWALRGGGGNFGVATRYRLALHPIARVLHGTLLMRATRDVVREVVPLGLAAPDDLTLMPTVMAIPPMDEVPASEHGKVGMFLDLMWAGQAAAGAAAIAPFRSLGPVLLDTGEEKAYPAVYGDPSGERNGWTAGTIFLDGLDDETMEIIERNLAEAPSEECLAHLRVLGGAAGRVPADATAFGWRDRPLLLWIIADYGTADGGALERHREWVSGFRRALGGKGVGGFVSFMADDAAEAAQAAYPAATWARLREVKRRYDPENFFRHNHNIPPAQDGA